MMMRSRRNWSRKTNMKKGRRKNFWKRKRRRRKRRWWRRKGGARALEASERKRRKRMIKIGCRNVHGMLDFHTTTESFHCRFL